MISLGGSVGDGNGASVTETDVGGITGVVAVGGGIESVMGAGNEIGGAGSVVPGSADGVAKFGDGAVARAGGGDATPGNPKACGVGTLSVAPARRILGLPFAKASGLPASRIAIIWGRLMAVEGRTRLATALKVSPGLTG